MRFWFDTEFYENGFTIELISIGVVSEDERTFYAETIRAPLLATKSQWLEENVKPHLRGITLNHTRLRNDLILFFGENPEIWGYYPSYDWVALCQIYGTMMDLPKDWPQAPLDIRQLAIDREVTDKDLFPAQTGAEHDALADAQWAREAWRHIINTSTKRKTSAT